MSGSPSFPPAITAHPTNAGQEPYQQYNRKRKHFEDLLKLPDPKYAELFLKEKCMFEAPYKPGRLILKIVHAMDMNGSHAKSDENLLYFFDELWDIKKIYNNKPEKEKPAMFFVLTPARHSTISSPHVSTKSETDKVITNMLKDNDDLNEMDNLFLCFRSDNNIVNIYTDRGEKMSVDNYITYLKKKKEDVDNFDDEMSYNASAISWVTFDKEDKKKFNEFKKKYIDDNVYAAEESDRFFHPHTKILTKLQKLQKNWKVVKYKEDDEDDEVTDADEDNKRARNLGKIIHLIEGLHVNKVRAIGDIVTPVYVGLDGKRWTLDHYKRISPRVTAELHVLNTYVTQKNTSLQNELLKDDNNIHIAVCIEKMLTYQYICHTATADPKTTQKANAEMTISINKFLSNLKK